MRKNSELMMIPIAAAAGFFGGLLAAHLAATQTAAAADKPATRAAAAMEEVLTGPGVISAQKFVLMSPDKHPRGMLGTDKKGMPVLEFYDADGVRRVMLAVGSNGTSLMLYGSSGTNNAGLTIAADGEPQLYMLDKNGSVSALLASQPGGGTLLALYPGGGKPRVVMAVLANGAPVLNLIDQKGGPVFKAP
jgi:hypothetical protein